MPVWCCGRCRFRSRWRTAAAKNVTVYIGYRILTRKELRDRERDVIKRYPEEEAKAAQTIDDLVAVMDRLTAREEGDVQLLLERVIEWRGIGDENGAAPFSADRLAALLEWDVYFRPIMFGLLEASRHGPSKNSSPGPAGTPARVQA